jgi:hypothetical protein
VQKNSGACLALKRFGAERQELKICVNQRKSAAKRVLAYKFFFAQSPTRLSASSRFSMELAMLKRR